MEKLIKFKKLLFFIILSLTAFSLCSCLNMSNYVYIEPIQDLRSIGYFDKIENQLYLTVFLEDIVNSEEYFSVEAFSRKTLSPVLKQTKLLTHSFYLINVDNERYYTLSFLGTKLKLYCDGFWVLNKETDISSFKLFIEGNNIWDVGNIFTEDLVDAQQTLKNIINAIKTGANYYYLDHVKKRQNSFNCNTAVYETIAFK